MPHGGNCGQRQPLTHVPAGTHRPTPRSPARISLRRCLSPPPARGAGCGELPDIRRLILATPVTTAVVQPSLRGRSVGSW